MSAGFRKGEMKSSSGRTIKTTDKVRAILSTSLCLAFDKQLDVVQADARQLKVLVSTEGPTSVLKVGVGRLRENVDELPDIFEELDEHACDEDRASYHNKFDLVMSQGKQVEDEVRLYCEQRDKVSVSKAELQHIKQRSRDLEEEFRAVESAYAKSLQMLGAGTAPASGHASSTPRDVKTRPLVTFNQSGAPSSIARTAASTHALTPVPPTLTSTAPVLDPTADALQRLAGVLESRGAAHHSGVSGKLPRVEPDVFSGDLISFPAWWNAFEIMVESRATTESEKLFYLSKFTAGSAHESMKGFLSLYSDPTSYRKARNIIVGRYGNRLKIAEAFKDRLNRWSPVKDGDGGALQAYADFLWQCHSAMDSLDYLANRGCQEENRKLSAKLPKSVGERWDRIVDDAVFGEEPDLTSNPSGLVGRFPDFQEFCRFTSREARIMISTCTKPTQAAASSGGKKKASALHVEVKDDSKKSSARASKPPAAKPPGVKASCTYCNGAHFLYQCEDFLNRAVEFKKAFAIERSLCFGCLKSNHTFRTCRIRNPEIMRDHVDKPPPSGATPAVPLQAMQVTGCEEEGSYSSMALAVWVYVDENPEHRILVYALLDTQSSGCFMSEDLADRLHTEPRQVVLELTTLGSKRSVTCGVVEGLSVKGEEGEEAVALPRCYTRRRIPGSHKFLPRPEQVAMWSHMRDVAATLAPPREEVDFGLLIGFNCGEALCTVQTRGS